MVWVDITRDCMQVHLAPESELHFHGSNSCKESKLQAPPPPQSPPSLQSTPYSILVLVGVNIDPTPVRISPLFARQAVFWSRNTKSPLQMTFESGTFSRHSSSESNLAHSGLQRRMQRNVGLARADSRNNAQPNIGLS